jgi:hypothetical protein
MNIYRQMRLALLRQIKLNRGMPFAVKIPNKVTEETLNESVKGKKLSVLLPWMLCCVRRLRRLTTLFIARTNRLKKDFYCP